MHADVIDKANMTTPDRQFVLLQASLLARERARISMQTTSAAAQVMYVALQHVRSCLS